MDQDTCVRFSISVKLELGNKLRKPGPISVKLSVIMEGFCLCLCYFVKQPRTAI